MWVKILRCSKYVFCWTSKVISCLWRAFSPSKEIWWALRSGTLHKRTFYKKRYKSSAQDVMIVLLDDLDVSCLPKKKAGMMKLPKDDRLSWTSAKISSDKSYYQQHAKTYAAEQPIMIDFIIVATEKVDKLMVFISERLLQNWAQLYVLASMNVFRNTLATTHTEYLNTNGHTYC